MVRAIKIDFTTLSKAAYKNIINLKQFKRQKHNKSNKTEIIVNNKRAAISAAL